MRIHWSPGAIADVAKLDRFLRLKSPTAAERATRTIEAGVRQLKDAPEIGRPRRVGDLLYRELAVPFGQSGYMVLYHFDDIAVFVIAVRHARETAYRGVILD